MKHRQLTFLLAVTVMLLMAVAPAFGSAIYPSQAVGDLVTLGGTDRNLTTATVDMVTRAYFSKYNTPTMMNSGGWTEPITLNIYSVAGGVSPSSGSLLASLSQSFFIPWRHEPTPSCGGTLWLGTDGVCHDDQGFDITFDFTSLGIVLPDQIIFRIAYNSGGVVENPLQAVGITFAGEAPEPGTVGLMLAGGLVLLVKSIRRRQEPRPN